MKTLEFQTHRHVPRDCIVFDDSFDAPGGKWFAMLARNFGKFVGAFDDHTFEFRRREDNAGLVVTIVEVDPGSLPDRSADPFVECPECGGRGGSIALQPAYSSAATSPREVPVTCERCEGGGELHVNELEPEDWSKL